MQPMYRLYDIEHNKKMSDLKKKLGQQGAKMFMNNIMGSMFGKS
jgi:hypothetical protein